MKLTHWSTIFLLGAALAVGAAAQKPQGLYKVKCASCHGADGTASTPAGKVLHARNFSSPEVKAESDADLAKIIANGKNKMPAFGKQLSAAQIKEMVAYVRELGEK